MGKRVNFCKDCKFCSYHIQKFVGWGHYCTNPKATLYNFVTGDTSYVFCGAVRQLDIDKLAEYWNEFKLSGDVTKLIEKYKDSNKKLQYCPLYRKKLTLGRLIKYCIIKIWRKL